MRLPRILKYATIGVLIVAAFAAGPLIYLYFSYYDSLEAELVQRFSGKRWNIPSRIYSDSTIVYPGQSLEDLGFFERLARLNYHRVDPGEVKTRGEFSYDKKKSRLTIFLHSFS